MSFARFWPFETVVRAGCKACFSLQAASFCSLFSLCLSPRIAARAWSRSLLEALQPRQLAVISRVSWIPRLRAGGLVHDQVDLSTVTVGSSGFATRWIPLFPTVRQATGAVLPESPNRSRSLDLAALRRDQAPAQQERTAGS